MESIGERLKKTREERDLSVEQVARDTNISRSYIQALEQDNFEAFPAEPYLLGFLRNYSDYLGLETEELISRYKAFKLQEQPAPMTALMHQPNPWPTRVFMIGGAAIVAVVLLIFLVPAVIDLVTHLPAMASNKPVGAPGKITEYTLGTDNANLTSRFYKGDQINVALGGEIFKFQVREIGAEVVISNANGGDNRLKLGEEAFLDLDNNNSPDVRISVSDFAPGNENVGAEIAFERLSKPKELNEAGSVSLTQEVKPAEPAPNQPQTGDVGAATNPSREKPTQVILEDTQAKPFTIDVVFRGYSLIRSVADGERREESYFHKGETMSIEASKKVALWVSNAGAFTGKINGNDLAIGRPGEVASVVIEWTTDPTTGKAQLKAVPMY